jgi:uncharacterized protein YkwD
LRSQQLRPLVALLTLALVVVAVAGATGRLQRAHGLEAALVREVNDLRRERGLPPVQPSADLRAAAASHSLDMAAHGYFAHDSRDGTAFWVRIRRFYEYPEAGTWKVGENLAWTTGKLSPEQLIKLWLDSPEHREVLFSPRWREVGLGAVKVEDAPGFYRGRDVTVITADFGIRGS